MPGCLHVCEFACVRACVCVYTILSDVVGEGNSPACYRGQAMEYGCQSHAYQVMRQTVFWSLSRVLSCSVL